MTASGAVSLLSSDEQNLQAWLERAANWGKTNNRPIFVGEFGSYGKGDMASRLRWPSFVRGNLEQRGLTWGYWEVRAGFGDYDRDSKMWRTELLAALIPK